MENREVKKKKRQLNVCMEHPTSLVRIPLAKISSFSVPISLRLKSTCVSDTILESPSFFGASLVP
jgi:hypothetical protein